MKNIGKMETSAIEKTPLLTKDTIRRRESDDKIRKI